MRGVKERCSVYILTPYTLLAPSYPDITMFDK